WRRALVTSRSVPPITPCRLGHTGRCGGVVAPVYIVGKAPAYAPRFNFSLAEVVSELHVHWRGGQKSKKRKSPCVVMPPFPLSRMMLSPRTQLLAPWLRSPSVRHETSPSTSTCDTPYGQGQRVMGEIDLNMTPGDSRDNQLSQENGDNQLGEENGDNQLGQENGDTQLSQENVDDQLVQENARRKLVLDDMRRRVIFETLLGRARNGNLKGNDTKEVSIQFSVPLRTVQRIWKK
ncbi:hypothetical protein PVAP13_9NG588214, partial [Panicum virgatum]